LFPHPSGALHRFHQGPVGLRAAVSRAASFKQKELERFKDAEEKLATNRVNLGLSCTEIKAGQDDRWTKLHDSRFLPGSRAKQEEDDLADFAEVGEFIVALRAMRSAMAFVMPWNTVCPSQPWRVS
jgi:hypothetical protein